jgi:hypothetical protein
MLSAFVQDIWTASCGDFTQSAANLQPCCSGAVAILHCYAETSTIPSWWIYIYLCICLHFMHFMHLFMHLFAFHAFYAFCAFSAFLCSLCIPMHFYALLCITMHYYAFMHSVHCIHFMHFMHFYSVSISMQLLCILWISLQLACLYICAFPCISMHVH